MAHWRLTPEAVKALSHDELEAMEMSFLLLERRQLESLDVLLGNLLGTTWDVKDLLDMAAKKGKPGPSKKSETFTWSLRDRPQKVFVPLILALTQNPKYLEGLRTIATSTRNAERQDPSVLNVPSFISDMQKKKERFEIVDLSTASKDEFLRHARGVVGR